MSNISEPRRLQLASPLNEVLAAPLLTQQAGIRGSDFGTSPNCVSPARTAQHPAPTVSS
eukprot:CAMPEP_0204380208 /NCGR_PEP_ID=MMETSP0469-20131031/53200_1 /ASSEMBLY_ACC=CAM_ASM_000384 /TAXON_ID=2969 /ORGANISM="Oxyrrhis marina" /LENGTH=58 /DNA_ID=CAMNT_0051371801 /DNA_START=68 /DNA_END=241 /DNA_ORIENTATION=+